MVYVYWTSMMGIQLTLRGRYLEEQSCYWWGIFALITNYFAILSVLCRLFSFGGAEFREPALQWAFAFNEVALQMRRDGFFCTIWTLLSGSLGIRGLASRRVRLVLLRAVQWVILSTQALGLIRRGLQTIAVQRIDLEGDIGLPAVKMN